MLATKRPQHAHPLSPPLLPPVNLHAPIKHLPAPPARNHNPTDDIDQPDEQWEEPAPLLRDRQGDGLDVELDKDAGDVVLCDLVRLRRDGVLVRLDGVRRVPDALCGVVRVAVHGLEEGQQRGVVGVDGGHDGEVVLELVEVIFGGGNGIVEGVDEGGVVRAEGELLDVVGEVEACEFALVCLLERMLGWCARRTSVVEVLAEFPVAVAARRDVEVALHLVAVQAAEDAARVAFAAQARRLGELLLLLGRAELVVDIPHIFPAGEAVVALAQDVLALAPLAEVGGVFAEQVACEGSVAGCVLHVHVEVGARHCDNNVDVDLHVVGDALLNGEGLRGLAGPPARDFGPGEVDACAEEEDGPRGRVATAGQVCLFGFGCEV